MFLYYIVQRSANIFGDGPESKYFRLRGPGGHGKGQRNVQH